MDEDFEGQATRAAAAICAEHGIARSVSYATLVELMALAWLAGRITEGQQVMEQIAAVPHE